MFEPISFEEFIKGRVCRSEARLDYDDYVRDCLEDEEVEDDDSNSSIYGGSTGNNLS